MSGGRIVPWAVLFLAATPAAAQFAASPAETAAPYAVAPPAVPAMTRSPEELSVTAINRMLKRLPDGFPRPSAAPRDLEGVWINGESYTPRIKRTATGAPTPITQAAAALMTERINQDNAGTPVSNASTRCRPPGQPKQLNLNFPFRIIETPSAIYFLFQEYHSVWSVRLAAGPTAARPPADASARSYSGTSVGWWDGDTLVIETSGYREPLWLDASGTPVSADGRLTHRIRKTDDGQALEVTTTVTDPAMYSAPWSFVRKMVWRPDMAVLDEYNCEQQVGSKDGEGRYGVGSGP